MRLLPLLAALLCSALASAPAHADEVEIANDKIGNMGMASLNFGGQLIKGEAVAETFTIPLSYLPFTITKARFFAGPAGMASLTFVLYEELGTPTPGKELARITPKDEVEGNTMFIQDVDLPATVVNSKNVRLAIYPDRDTTNGGLWSADPARWARYDMPWRTHEDPGGARLLGTVQIAYGTPTRYEITLYRATITAHASRLGWTVVSLCDAALWQEMAIVTNPNAEHFAPSLERIC